MEWCNSDPHTLSVLRVTDRTNWHHVECSVMQLTPTGAESNKLMMMMMMMTMMKMPW